MKLSEVNARKEARKEEAKLRQQQRRVAQVYSIIEKYQEAFKALNNAKIYPKYRNGWVTVGWDTMRLEDLEKATEVLWARVHEIELNIPEQSL